MKKIIICLLCVLCSCISICGCNQLTPSNHKTPVTFVLDWTPNTNHTGLYVAKALGFFEEEGISLNIVMPPEDGALSLLAAGKADFGMDAQDTLAIALAQKEPLPITAVAAVIQHNDSGILTNNKEITRFKDLENHSYATWGSPIEEAILHYIVEKDGGDPNKIHMLPLAASDILAAFSSGVDAAWVYYPWEGILTNEKGISANYFPLIKSDPVFDYYTPLIVAGNHMLQEKPEVAKRFLKALQKGYLYAIQNPEKAAELLTQEIPEIDRETAEKSQQYLQDKYQAQAPYWGYIDPQRWRTFYEWLNDHKIIETPINPDGGYSNEYLDGE